MTFGSYFWYDWPNVVSEQIKHKITHEGEDSDGMRYNQLYAAVSYPNFIMPLIGGILADKFGIGIITILFSSVSIAGHVIVTYAWFIGTDNQNDDWPYYLSFIGRLVYGLGGEIMSVWQHTIVSRWFMEKELSFAIAVMMSITWAGGVLSFFIVPPVAEAFSLGHGMALGVILSIFSLIVTVLILFLDKYAAKIDKERGLVEAKDEEGGEDEAFKWSDIKEFDRMFWILNFNWVLSYWGMLFYNISDDFFITRYGFDEVGASRIGSIITLIGIFFGPLFGYLSDLLGRRVTFSILSTIGMSLSYALFIIIPSSTSDKVSYFGIAPFGMLGITATIYGVVISPMYPLIVKPKILATAYGISAWTMNIGMAIGPILIGALTIRKKKENTYLWVNVLLMSLWIMSVICSVLMWFYDKKDYNGILQKSAKQIEQESMTVPNTKVAEDTIDSSKLSM